MIEAPVLFDTESQSRADLKKVGGRRYWEHASSHVLCAAWYDTANGQAGCWLPGEEWPHKGRLLAAHNMSGFDRFACIRMEWMTPDDPWIDTSELARRAGLPGALDALGTRWLNIPKDKEASKFTKGLSSIRRPSGKGNPNAIPADVWRTYDDLTKRERGVLHEVTAEDMKRVVPYCFSDVEILAHGWPDLEIWLDLEPEVERVDRLVNDRGVYFDRDLAKQLLACDEYNAEEVCARVGAQLGLSASEVRVKAMSQQQFREETGAENAQKATVQAMEHPLAQARLALASIASGKLEAGLARVSGDSRLRDTLRYYGASTGRWSGRGMQLQNMPRPAKHFEDDWEKAFGKGEEAHPHIDDWICRLVDAVTEGTHVALQDEIDLLVRASICAAPGKGLSVWDFSGVEARALAWVANDEPAIAAFLSGKDTYKVAAAYVFGVPYDSVTKLQRQLGKILELACLDAKTQVLTDSGLKRIVDVQLTDKVWDGVEWQTHQGVVYRGMKETVDCCGVRATPDHLVMCGPKTWYPLERLGQDGNIHCRALAHASGLLSSAVLKSTMEGGSDSCLRSAIAGRLSIGCSTTTCEVERRLGVLPAQRKPVEQPRSNTGLTPTSCQTTPTEGDYSIDTQRSTLDANAPRIATMPIMGGVASDCAKGGETIDEPSCGMWPSSRDGMTPSSIWTASTTPEDTSPEICGLSAEETTVSTDEASPSCKPGSTSLRPVYDIAFAGPRNRYAVMTCFGILIVHNCGYGQGGKKFAETAAKMGADLEAVGINSFAAVKAWRKLHAPIVKFWQDCEDAFVKAVHGIGSHVGPFFFAPSADGKDVAIFLPSGRPIVYCDVRISQRTIYDEDTGAVKRVTNSIAMPGMKGTEWLYGGLIVENIIQAMCRDLMADALVRAEVAGLCPVMTVHDEIVIEQPWDALKDAHRELGQIMRTWPEWAKGFPGDAAGFMGRRYRK